MKKLLFLFSIFFFIHLNAQSNDDWPMWRLDRHNTGVSPIIGPFVEPSIRWKYFLGGSVNQSMIFDVNSDNQNENIILAGGKILVFKKDGSLLWQTPPSAITRIEGVYDFDNDGKFEILASSSSPPTLFIYSGDTGNISWKHVFDEPAQGVGSYGIVVDDLDNSSDGMLEIFCWPSISPHGIAFSFSSGVSSGKEFWRAYANEPGDGYIAPVASADIDADGETEVIIATLGSIYVYNGTTGKTETRFAFKGGKSGRNYGKLNILNLDDDDFLEIVMLADNLDEHISVIDQVEAGFYLRWNKYYEYSYPEDNKELRFSLNSISDFDQDGNIEIVGSIYNDTGDNSWHLIVFDALSGDVKLDLPGYYYWGAEDIDSDGVMEIIAGEETSRRPSNGNLVALEGDKEYATKWSGSDYSVMMNPSPNKGSNINSTSGTPEVYIMDYDNDEVSEMLFYRAGSIVVADGSSSNLEDEVTLRTSSQSFNLISIGDLGGVDESMEFVLTGSDGMLRVLTSEGSEIISKEVGTYKQGKPIVADLDSDGNKEVLIQDASGKINVLSFDPSSSQGAPDLIWTFQGFGKMAKYFRSFTPLVSDLEGDGKKEIILASTSKQVSLASNNDFVNPGIYNPRLSEELHELDRGNFKKLTSIGNTLVILDHTGSVKREIVLPDQPFEWNVGNFDGDEVLDIFVSYYAGGIHVGHSRVYSGKEELGMLWESEIAPYSGYAVIYDIDLDGIDDIIMREHFDLRALSGVDGKDLIPIKSVGGYHTPILMDVNNDGDYEIINGGGYLTVLVNDILRGQEGASGAKDGNVWVDDFEVTSGDFPVWNGDFEQDNDYNGKADHWEDAWVSDPENAYTSIDKTQSYSGSSSLKVTTKGKDDYIYNYQAHVSGFEVGESYSFKAMMKTDMASDPNSSAFIYARAADSNWGFISHSVSNQLNGLNDWTELTLDFVVPDNTHFFNLECVILRGGQGSYDGPLACPVIWQNKTGYNDAYARMPGTADSDGDGIPDILVSSTTGVLTLYDGSNGGSKWSYNIGTTASDIVSADIDKDHRYEYIFGGTDGFLYAMNGEKTSRKIVVKYNIGSEVGDPIIADLDKDGRMEVLFSASDGYLYSLEDDITTINIDESNSEKILPERIGVKLGDIFPNPFNSSTVIRFDSKTERDVIMDLYAINGRKVKTLYDGRVSSGAHKVNWNGRDSFGSEVSSGIYLVVLNDGLNVQTKRIALIR